MRGIRRRTIGVRIAVLGAVGFLTAYGAHIVVAGLPAYGRRLGLGYGAIGLLLASYNLAEIVAKPLAGRLADRIGARPVMFWGTAFFSLSCLMYLVSPPAALPAFIFSFFWRPLTVAIAPPRRRLATAGKDLQESTVSLRTSRRLFAFVASLAPSPRETMR